MSASAQKQTPSQNACCCTTTPKGTTYSDSSGVIFSMYIDRAQKFDDEIVENWKGGADSILVFTGIFSATVATFIAMSYPLLQQDPNAPTTQSLLIKISQQLADPNGIVPPASSFDQSSFVPSGWVVFINSVWFLSLVLSLTCALIATLLQQWARRYLQMVQGNHPPHDRAHIREYFSRGAHRFRIFALVEALPFLLLVSVLLFFGGLVAFAFLANRTAACITAAIVGFCILSYIALTLMPLRHHDCPYHTPFTSLIWYTTQLVPLSCLSLVYHVAKKWYGNWGGPDKNGNVESLRVRQQKWAKSFSDGRVSSLEKSARAILPTMDIYKKTLVQTLEWLTGDHELEKFVTGIPGLYESEALALATATPNNNGTQRTTIRDILAALPGPKSFRTSLPWSIIQLARRASTNKLPESVQLPRTRACLKALYYIPGAIRDVLAPYAAKKNHSSRILPLLNSLESLEIINELQNTSDDELQNTSNDELQNTSNDELQNTSKDDVVLPARCVAAVVAAYMITTPPSTTPNVFFIGNHDAGKQFLRERLHVSGDADSGDSARLQNIVRFLTDIKGTLGKLNKQWWTSNNTKDIRRKYNELLEVRSNLPEGRYQFDQQLEGNRALPEFVPAAQLDLITLTLEILARDSFANAATSQRKAFRDAFAGFVQVAFTEAREQAKEQALGRPLAQAVLANLDQEVLNWIDQQTEDGIKRIERTLPSLLLQTNEKQAPQIESLPSNSTSGRARISELPPSRSPTEHAPSPSSLGPSHSALPTPATAGLDIESRGSLSC